MNLRSTLLSTVLALSLSAIAAEKLVPPKSKADLELAAAFKRSLGPCFTTVGAKQAFPQVQDFPTNDKFAFSVLMGATGAYVNDGYEYILAVPLARNEAYVTQVGGNGASPRTYGPLAIATTCK